MAAAIIVFVEKLFLNFVAINFHQKALADRLEENRLGLKALDSLSKAQPVASKKLPYHKRGQHKRMSSAVTIDFATLPHQGEQQDDISTTRGHLTTLADDSRMFASKSSPELQPPKRRRKKVTSVIVNQVRHLVYRSQPRFFDCVSNQGGRSNRSICIEKFQVL